MAKTVFNLQQLKDAIASLSFLNIGYTRVSTDNRDQDTSIERQIEDFKDAGCNLIVVERESGRSTEKRLLYLAVLDLIRQGSGSLDVIRLCCTTSSRLNRNASEALYIERLCAMRSVPLIYLDQPELNIASASAENNRIKEAYSAELFSRQLSFSVKKGNERIRKNRKPIAKRSIFGYRINKKTKDYEIDWIEPDLSNAIALDGDNAIASGELAAKVIQYYLEYGAATQALYKLKTYLKSLTPVDMKKFEKVMSLSTPWIHKWLANPGIRGHLVYNQTKQVYYGEKLQKSKWVPTSQSERIIIKNTHDAIASLTDFAQVDRLIKINKNKAIPANKSRGCENTLSPIIFCSVCGRRYNRTGDKRGNVYYRCRGRIAGICDQQFLREKSLIKMLIDEIISKSQKVSDVLMAIEDIECDRISEQLRSLREESEQAMANYQANRRQSYFDLYNQINQEIESLERQNSASSGDSEDRDAIVASISDLEFWNTLGYQETIDYLLRLIKACWIDSDSKCDRIDLAI